MCVFGGCGERKSVFPSPDQADAIDLESHLKGTLFRFQKACLYGKRVIFGRGGGFV